MCMCACVYMLLFGGGEGGVDIDRQKFKRANGQRKRQIDRYRECVFVV